MSTRTFYPPIRSLICSVCNGLSYDEQFRSNCPACQTPAALADYAAHHVDAVHADPIIRGDAGVGFAPDEQAHRPNGNGPGRTQHVESVPREAGWTKFDGAWCALLPVGSKVEAGAQVTLVNKAGKRTDVVLTGTVLARLRYGIVAGFTDAPATPAPATTAPPAARTAPTTGVRIAGVPAGTYMLPGSDLRVRFDVVDDGKWAGYVFVKNGSEYSTTAERYGRQVPDGTYSGKLADVVAAIVADPQAAAAEFGRRTGCCALCSRVLEDAESVARGIGPVCLRKF